MIEIIPFRQEYLNDAVSLALDIQQNELGLPVTLEQQPDLKNIEAFYQTRGGNFWVALDQKKLVGTIALINAGDGIGVLRKMYVLSSYRGAPHKVAESLLKILMTWARDKALKTIILGTVGSLKAAQRFYEKSGFKRIEEKTLPVCIEAIKLPLDTHYYQMDLHA